jgi:bacterioferritin-associated ferredoxin
MIVCLCHGVPERVVDETIAAGASTVKEIGLACGAGMGCGACHCMLAKKLATQCSPTTGGAVTRLPLDSVSPTG